MEPIDTAAPPPASAGNGPDKDQVLNRHTRLLAASLQPWCQGVRVANLVWELIIGIETVRDRRKPKYAINRTILDKNFHKQLILRMYWQRKAMKHP